MKTDQKMGLVILAFCVAMWFFIIPNQCGGKVESLFPRFVTVFMAVPAFFLILSRKDTSKEIPYRALNKKGIVLVIVIAIMFLIYIFMISFLGYFVSSFLALVAFMVSFGERDWKRIVFVPAIVMLFIYFLIHGLLNFPFPKGIIF